MAVKPRASVPSFAKDLYAFASAQAETPYHDLAKAFFDAGWLTRLEETDHTLCPDGTVLVHFDLLVGRDIDAFEKTDSFVMRMGAGPGPVSIAARLAARETVVFLLSGRLPPPQATMQPPAAQPPQPEPEPEPELPGERPPEPTAAAEEAPLRVVLRREPDGLPIFRDLYDIGADEARTTGDIIDAVLAEVQSFLESTTSIEAVSALAAKNPDMLTFVKDVGTEQDVADLMTMVKRRQGELARPVTSTAPRRRSPGVPRAN